MMEAAPPAARALATSAARGQQAEEETPAGRRGEYGPGSGPRATHGPPEGETKQHRRRVSREETSGIGSAEAGVA